MKSKYDLTKLFALFCVLMLITPCYGQLRRGNAGPDVTRAASNTLPIGDRMTRTQLEQSCADGNPSLRVDAFVASASYGNYLAMCAEIKRSLSARSDKSHAGVIIPIPVEVRENKEVHQPPTSQKQDDVPAKSRPSLMPDMINIETKDNINDKAPSAPSRTGRVNDNDVIKDIPNIKRTRDAVANPNSVNSSRPISRPLPNSTFSTNGTTSRTSSQFQRPNSTTNIFNARQERINGRQNVSRTEVTTPVRPATNANPISNQVGSSDVTSSPSSTGNVVGMIPAALEVIDSVQQADNNFAIQCDQDFLRKVNFDSPNKNFEGQHCCQVLYNKLLTDLENNLPPGTRQQLQAKNLSTAFTAITTMGAAKARGLLHDISTDSLTPPGKLYKKRHFTPNGQNIKTSPGKDKELDVTIDNTEISNQKKNISLIKSYIKSADVFLDPGKASTLKRKLLDAIKAKNYASANSAINEIKAAADNNLQEAEVIYQAHQNSAPSSDGKTPKNSKARIAPEQKFKNEVSKLQEKCKTLFRFTILQTSKTVIRDIK